MDFDRMILKNVLQENRLYNPDTDSPLTVDELFEQLSEFSNESPIELEDSAIYATAAIVGSEAGDTFLVLEEGLKTERQIALETFVEAPLWWGGFTNMFIEDHKVIKVSSNG